MDFKLQRKVLTTYCCRMNACFCMLDVTTKIKPENCNLDNFLAILRIFNKNP